MLDKYVLLQPFTDNKNDSIYAYIDQNNGSYAAYYVNSVTSSTIAKMLRKKRQDEIKKKVLDVTKQLELTPEQKKYGILKNGKISLLIKNGIGNLN
jgi:hypothetical protein